MKEWMAVFMGGGLGSLLRFGVQCAVARCALASVVPWATLAVNLLGSFLIGLFYAWSSRFHWPEAFRLLLTTGLCGGFTTFSTFSHEGMALLRDGHWAACLCYAVASVAAGVAFAFFGAWVGSWMGGEVAR